MGGADENWAAVIRRREAEVKAFAWIDLERALRLSAEAAPGPLHGAWVGVKDIVDTAGIPTERGCALYRGRVPERSAEVVRRIEAAGGVVAGKTVTAELASATPGPTTNPWDPKRTPGGSSMGSAAAVAAGMLPLAIGTQTAGSVIRPAAFCGVVGFKPSAGLIPMDGVMTLSQTLDQPGAFATNVAAAAELASVMAGTGLSPLPPQVRPRFAIYRGPEWTALGPAARDSFEQAADRLRTAGASVEETSPPDGFDQALPAQRTIMVVEAVQNLGPDVARAPELVSEAFRRHLAAGERTPAADYRAALDERRRLIAAVAGWARPFDAVLCPSAMGEAPGLATTGDPRQLCAAPGEDRRLLGAAAWAEAVLATAGAARA